MTGRAGIPKNRYQQKIHTYEERRQRLREKYGYTPGRVIPGYGEAVRNLTNKISRWKRAIKRIEERQAKLELIAGRTELFYEGITLKNSAHSHKPEVCMARKLFYKYALEHGCRSRDAAVYVGGKQPQWPATKRLQFTRSFKTQPENRELWHRFLKHMKEQQ